MSRNKEESSEEKIERLKKELLDWDELGKKIKSCFSQYEKEDNVCPETGCVLRSKCELCFLRDRFVEDCVAMFKAAVKIGEEL